MTFQPLEEPPIVALEEDIHMRVFITGATGFIGTAVVRELLDAGHEVIGLARSDISAETLLRAGAQVHRGSLEDLDSLRRGADMADGVIHTAFYHRLSHMRMGTRLKVMFGGNPRGAGLRFMGAAVEADRQAIKVLASTLRQSGGPLIIASGTLSLPPGKFGTEDDAGVMKSVMGPRMISEEITLDTANHGVRSIVLRLPPSVHGEGDSTGFLPGLIRIARKKGFSGYVEDGTNRWPSVHRMDAARLFRLALEHAPAASRVHAVADEGVPFRDIAEIIGRKLNLPVKSVSQKQAGGHFGLLAAFASADNPSTSALTQARLGWRPVQPGILEDLEQGHYFTS